MSSLNAYIEFLKWQFNIWQNLLLIQIGLFYYIRSLIFGFLVIWLQRFKTVHNRLADILRDQICLWG